MFDSTRLLLVYLDAEFKIIQVNAAYAAALGRAPEFWQGKDYFSLYPSEKYQAIFQQARLDGECYGKLAAPWPCGDAQPAVPSDYWDWYLIPLKNERHQVTGLVLTLLDVSQRMRTETNALRLATVIEQAPVTVVITDLAANILYANAYFEVSTGYQLAEVIGQNPRVLQSGQTSQQQYKDLWHTLTSGRTWRGRFINKRKNGELYAEAVTVFPIKDEHHAIINYAAVKRDISTQERAEEAHRESERNYRQLFEVEVLISEYATRFINLPVALIDAEIRRALCSLGHFVSADRSYVFLLDTPPTTISNTYEWCTPAAMPAPQVNSQHMRLDIFPGLWSLLQQHRLVHIRSLEDLPIEFSAVEQQHFRQLMTGLGVRSLALYPLIFGGRLTGLIGFESRRIERNWDGADLALLKGIGGSIASALQRRETEWALAEERGLLAQRVEERTEALRITNAKLARAAQAKDEFLATMNHELRTPLNAILNLSEMLEEQLWGPLNDKQNKYLRAIQESGQHLLSLINDVLDVAKIDAGKTELDWDCLSVPELCETSLRLIRQEALNKPLTLHLTLDPQVIHLRGDGRRLKQILVNLLHNALKFTPAGKNIGLEVQGDTAQALVNFTVWDEGIGIAEADMPRLFQPFVQLDSRLSRHYVGTGLGLALVKRLTELHGGQVKVQSVPEQGSRFSVLLPWTEETQQSPQCVANPTLLEGGAVAMLAQHELILLAEDNEANRHTFSVYLRSQGYRVMEVVNGEAAVTQSLLHHPDLILMDIQMPGMDGLEAIRQIRAQPALPQRPIIALTALTMPGDRERCLQAGATLYLQKPVSLKSLLLHISQQLHNPLVADQGAGR